MQLLSKLLLLLFILPKLLLLFLLRLLWILLLLSLLSLLFVIISRLAVHLRCSLSRFVRRFPYGSGTRSGFSLFTMMPLSSVKRFTSIIRTAGCSLITVWTCKPVRVSHGIYSESGLGIRTVNLYILSCQSLRSIISAIGLGLSKCVDTRTRRSSNRACIPLGTGIHICFTGGCEFGSVLCKTALIILIRRYHFKLGPVHVQ